MAEYTLVVTSEAWNRLTEHLDGTSRERMVMGYCTAIVEGSKTRFLLREVDCPQDEEYTSQTPPTKATLRAEKTIRYLLRAKEAACLLDVHSHPSMTVPSPSPSDDLGVQAQYDSLQAPAPGAALLRMIRCPNGAVWAEVIHGPAVEDRTPLQRILIHGRQGLRLIRPGNRLNAASPLEVQGARRGPPRESEDSDRRTVACLGEDGLCLTRQLTVGLIGVGGVGSVVARLLAGVAGKLILVDPDRLEAHNIPRVWFAEAGRRGLKVASAKRSLRRAFPQLEVLAFANSFPAPEAQERLAAADILIACPDHNAVRYSASQFAASNLQPLIEVGCGGKTRDGLISALGYHVRLQVPGGPCLACNGLDLSKLEDPSSTRSKRQAGYMEDEGQIPGELACLTTRAAADAADLFLRYCTQYAGRPPLHLYGDALHFKCLDLTEHYPCRCSCRTAVDLVAGTCDVMAAGV